MDQSSETREILAENSNTSHERSVRNLRSCEPLSGLKVIFTQVLLQLYNLLIIY